MQSQNTLTDATWTEKWQCEAAEIHRETQHTEGGVQLLNEDWIDK